MGTRQTNPRMQGCCSRAKESLWGLGVQEGLSEEGTSVLSPSAWGPSPGQRKGLEGWPWEEPVTVVQSGLCVSG